MHIINHPYKSSYMQSLLTLLKSPILLITGAIFSWFSVKYLPSIMLLFWLVVAVGADLVTGVLKTWSKGGGITSTGLRKTVVKIGSYVGTIVMVIALVNVIGLADINNTYNLTVLLDMLMGFMVFIELYSICENISEAYPNSLLVTYMISRILKLLKGKLLKGPTPEEKKERDEI